VKEAVQNMCRVDVDCVSVLVECVKALPKNPREALSLADKEVLEEEIDELYSVARRRLAAHEFKAFTVGAIILLNMFLDVLETVADWCENSADAVRALAVRGL
jgi:uncharacterized protein Yka (UPF0111/DUF47 family)